MNYTTPGLRRSLIVAALSAVVPSACVLADAPALDDSLKSGLVLWLDAGVNVSATLNVPSNGFYYAAVTVAGLAVEDNSAAGVYNSYKYYPARAKVSVDGSDVAELLVESPDFTRLGVRLPYLSAGPHVIAVTGLLREDCASGGKVRVEKAELLPLSVEESGAYDISNSKFVLKDGATLGLEYLGTLTCRGVKVGGVPLSGVVGAGTSASLLGPGLLDIRPHGFNIIIR